jgi:hypothetical protein
LEERRRILFSGAALCPSRRCAIFALVAGAGGVTVEPAMKMLSAKAKISGLAPGAERLGIFMLPFV